MVTHRPLQGAPCCPKTPDSALGHPLDAREDPQCVAIAIHKAQPLYKTPKSGYFKSQTVKNCRFATYLGPPGHKHPPEGLAGVLQKHPNLDFKPFPPML